MPSYVLEYSPDLDADGQVVLRGAVTQSGVSSNFKMMIPIYLDVGQGPVRLGEAILRGDVSTPPFSVRLPQKPKRVFLNAFHDVLALEVENREK